MTKTGKEHKRAHPWLGEDKGEGAVGAAWRQRYRPREEKERPDHPGFEGWGLPGPAARGSSQTQVRVVPP